MMTDVTLIPNQLPAKERSEFIHACCNGVLEEIDSLITEVGGNSADRLASIREQVVIVQKIADDCKTNEDFDRAETKLTALLNSIARDLDGAGVLEAN